MIARPDTASALLEGAASSTEEPSGGMRLWGFSTVELHDRWWASKRVRVVRPGTSFEHEAGPDLYLLIDRHDLLMLKLTPLVKRMTWLKPRAMRLRVVDPEPTVYEERVRSTPDGRFERVERSYRQRTRATGRAWLTASVRAARAWAASSDAKAGHSSVFKAIGRDGVVPMSCRGLLFEAGSDDEPDFLDALLHFWTRPDAVIDGIYEFQPGVWVHEQARVERGVRVVPPLWVGAGTRLRTGSVAVGPRMLADRPGLSISQRPVEWADLRLPRFRVLPKWRRRRWRRVSKRLFDIGFSLCVLAATAPLYPIIMLLIMLEDGRPAFFAHTRQTIKGREFPCYKFRTMCRDADKMKAELEALNACDGPQFYIEDDPRLLKVGKVLRKFQLDELPQFWNVFRGHMSVVGPRPSPDKENQFCPAWREARLSVRPGVTGLWQVRRTRAPETDFQEWIRYDLEYVRIDNWRLDIWIIFETIRKIIVRK